MTTYEDEKGRICSSPLPIKDFSRNTSPLPFREAPDRTPALPSPVHYRATAPIPQSSLSSEITLSGELPTNEKQHVYREPQFVVDPTAAFTAPARSYVAGPRAQSEEYGDWEDDEHGRSVKRVLDNTLEFFTIGRAARRARREDDADEPLLSQPRRPNLHQLDSTWSVGDQELYGDHDNHEHSLHDPDDQQKACKLQMTAKGEHHAKKMRITYNITSILNRQTYLRTLALALLELGAPSHRTEALLRATSRILDINAEYINLPNVILVAFGDQQSYSVEVHFVKRQGGINLGKLASVHDIYRRVARDKISAKKGTEELERLLAAPPEYGFWWQIGLAFSLSALICPLAFGGSFIDMWIAGALAAGLCYMQIGVKNPFFGNIFELTAAMTISFIARALSSIQQPHPIFCYNAISSASIISILPGFLLLTSFLELASKQLTTGSVRLMYALIYTLFLGFGLQIGSDLYLLIDKNTRHTLDGLAQQLQTSMSIAGSFVGQDGRWNASNPLSGTFTFLDVVDSPLADEVFRSCYRAPDAPWYLRPFPWWTQFIIVPLFSTLSSLGNQQPWHSRNLPVMVVIAIAGYASNTLFALRAPDRPDLDASVGAFFVGALGNIYARCRKEHVPAYTIMVTGVLLLVPSGLSEEGGLTAQGSAVNIGGAVLGVAVGSTVGLLMSQWIIFVLCGGKNGASFSF